MITQTTDEGLVRAALALYPDHKIDLDVETWLSSPLTRALTEDGNVGMFEEFYPGVWTGHYFFHIHGKAAKQLAIRMMAIMFVTAEAIRGLTPLDNKPAIWMTRHLGFKQYGTVETSVGECAVFVMTKDEFNARYGNLNG